MERNKSSSRRIRDPRGAALTALKYLVLIIGAVVMMFPFIWMLLTSLKTLPEAISIPPQWLPSALRWENWSYSWNLVPFALYFRNTIWVGFLSVVLTLTFSILGAYAFTIYSFPGRNLCFYLFMLTMMVPSEILIIQNYVTCSTLGILDSFTGIVLPTVANGFYIFMLQADAAGPLQGGQGRWLQQSALSHQGRHSHEHQRGGHRGHSHLHHRVELLHVAADRDPVR